MDSAGDFREFRPKDVNASLHRLSTISPHLLGLLIKKGKFLKTGMPGWGANVNLDMTISKWDPLTCSRGATEPRLIAIRKPLETLEF